MPDLPKPTDTELEVLRVLWRRSAATVRDVHDDLAHRATGYTTTLKTMQVMHGKGLLTRSEDGRAHTYRAAIAQADTGRRLLGELLDRVFDGSAKRLVLQALDLDAVDAGELAAVRKLLAERRARTRAEEKRG